jgi:hypothetical protein
MGGTDSLRVVRGHADAERVLELLQAIGANVCGNELRRRDSFSSEKAADEGFTHVTGPDEGDGLIQ